ncbi:hypothetical protein HPB51_018164 [Rhipicephalus microplus]|uniref:tRNA-queuosine alpha-mannosyltransferase n=1 Tax=Rhipicephalus microplus TaxID=6941 RepID=A0A9J6D5Q5_RHIMP|nr:hypothetical protein HPB51_018164 [Rhipicephalus microplus]
MSVLLLEPFYGGSHKQLIDLLSEDLGVCRLVTLPPNKWHWRARTAALWLAERIEPSDHYRVLMASGTLNLAELLGLRQDLVPLRKVLYMHENQLAYPVQKEQLRDYQYGYNQVVSCLAADVVLFNSHFNRDSFLAAVEPFLNRVPGAGHLGPLRPQLEAKARVLSFPVKVPPLFPALYRDPTSPLHVVWPHRCRRLLGLSPESVPVPPLTSMAAPTTSTATLPLQTTLPSQVTLEHPRVPEVFHGEEYEDVEDWLEQFERVAVSNHWNE